MTANSPSAAVISPAFRRVIRVAAWCSLAFVAFATLGPLGLRPTTGLSPQLERLAAFFVVGGLFAAAYPRHIILAAIVVLGTAVLLELLQLLAPSRHGRLFDAGIKIVGGSLGLVLGWVLSRWVHRR
jgi:hypothetical protein